MVIGPHGRVRDLLRAEGLDAKTGKSRPFGEDATLSA